MRRFYVQYSLAGDKDKLSASEKAAERGEIALLMLSHLTAIFYFLGITQFELARFRAAKESRDYNFDDLELALESIGELGQKLSDGCYENVNEALTYYQKTESEGKK